MQLNSDVLPAPLGPTRPKIAPGSTSKLTSSSTLMPPKRSDTSFRFSRAAMCHLSQIASLLGSAAALTYRSSETLWIADEIVNDFGTNSGFVIIA